MATRALKVFKGKEGSDVGDGEFEGVQYIVLLGKKTLSGPLVFAHPIEGFITRMSLEIFRTTRLCT